MSARRDQLVLGAAAAALMIAIVAFAASSSGVKGQREVPTPRPTPESERELFGGSLHPDLRVGPAKPATVADLAGETFNVAVSFKRPAIPAGACRPLPIQCTEVAPNRYYPDGTRLRMFVLDKGPGGPLVIDLRGTTQRDLEKKLEGPAAELLRTLRIG